MSKQAPNYNNQIPTIASTFKKQNKTKKMTIYLTLFRVGTRHARRLRVMLPKRGK